MTDTDNDPSLLDEKFENNPDNNLSGDTITKDLSKYHKPDQYVSIREARKRRYLPGSGTDLSDDECYDDSSGNTADKDLLRYDESESCMYTNIPNFIKLFEDASFEDGSFYDLSENSAYEDFSKYVEPEPEVSTYKNVPNFSKLDIYFNIMHDFSTSTSYQTDKDAGNQDDSEAERHRCIFSDVLKISDDELFGDYSYYNLSKFGEPGVDTSVYTNIPNFSELEIFPSSESDILAAEPYQLIETILYVNNKTAGVQDDTEEDKDRLIIPVSSDGRNKHLENIASISAGERRHKEAFSEDLIFEQTEPKRYLLTPWTAEGSSSSSGYESGIGGFDDFSVDELDVKSHGKRLAEPKRYLLTPSTAGGSSSSSGYESGIGGFDDFSVDELDVKSHGKQLFPSLASLKRRETEEKVEELIFLGDCIGIESSFYLTFKDKPREMCASGGMSVQHSQKLWNSFLSEENKHAIEVLLDNNLMPRNKELTNACEIFGKDSEIVEKICSKICGEIMVEYNSISRVWPAYSEDDENSVIFVAVRKTDFNERVDYSNFNIVVRGERQKNSENRDVIEKEIDTNTRIDIEEMLLLKAVINQHSHILRRQHSNISFISASPYRSTGFLSGNHQFVKENCVLILVHVKGLIPINEKPFPKSLEYGNCGIGVDVREGTFQLYVGGRPKAVHRDLKMGCAIGPAKKKYFGTLGGFVDHNEYGLCAITCAHVLLEANQLQQETPNPNIVCVQPDAEEESESQRCGLLQQYIFRKGSERQSGVDAALVKIDATREPLDGLFPDTDQNDLEKAGFDETDKITYASGAVHELADILKHRDRRLIKYGASSCLTRGVFGFVGLEFAYSPLMYFGRADLILNNQIQVYHIKKCGDFAKPGDSGSLVFSVSEDGLTAIGLLLGGDDGFSVVTPICDVLQAVGCSAPYSLKRFQDNNNCKINKYNECFKEQQGEKLIN